MLKEKRLDEIVKYVEESRYASINELANLLNISTATVRRDIDTLVKSGRVASTRGGVTSVGKEISYYEDSYFEKAITNTEEKVRVAKAVMQLIKPKSTIYIDSGTTTFQMVHHLMELSDVNIITNDIRIASELTENPNIGITVIGGSLRNGYYTATGYFAEEFVSNIHADFAIIGIDAVDVDHGLMITNQEEIGIKRKIIEVSSEVIVLCDHTKFKQKAYLSVCPLSKVDVIISGKETDPEIVEAIENKGTRVVLA